MSADSPISDQPTLVIRHGLVHDGTGGEPVRADVAISGASITAVAAPGTLPAAPDEIDATGRIVTPGFVDTHSHLDGAVVWESRLTPNSGHGITTTVMGNCGVGFAPCRPDHRDFTIDLMEGVEDIPRDVLEAGLTWTWESYPEYLDALASNRYDMDVFSLLPHSCLRVEAMGVERAIDGSTASAAELATMSQLAVAALRAGAVGIASTRLVGQQTRDGRPAPSRFADQDELQTLADAIATAGHGVLQIAPEFNRYPDAVDELTMVIAAAERADIPLTYSLKQTNGHPQGWRQLLSNSRPTRSSAACAFTPRCSPDRPVPSSASRRLGIDSPERPPTRPSATCRSTTSSTRCASRTSELRSSTSRMPMPTGSRPWCHCYSRSSTMSTTNPSSPRRWPRWRSAPGGAPPN